MKRLLLLPLIAGILLFVSCEKDPQVVFPGTWTIESGGELYFGTDGKGYSLNASSSYFTNGCLSITSDTIPFNWTTTQTGSSSKGTLRLDYLESDGVTTCGAYTEIAYTIKGKDKIELGAEVFGIGIIENLSRK